MRQESAGVHHRLVRCLVENDAGEQSVRFVEETHFRLWQYMVVNRHRLRVSAPAACVWLPLAEYAAHEQLFSRTGASEPVDRLAFAVYDPIVKLVTTLQRFVPAADAARLREHLLGRFPETIRDTDDLHVDEERGVAFVRANDADAARIGYNFVD